VILLARARVRLRAPVQVSLPVRVLAHRQARRPAVLPVQVQATRQAFCLVRRPAIVPALRQAQVQARHPALLLVSLRARHRLIVTN
jgi:hypothetical protein